MKLGNDKPSVLLRKMKSLFYGKSLDGVLVKVLRSLFLQALTFEIRLYLIGDDIPLDDIAQKADAIYAELKYNSPSSYASDTKSPNLQFYEIVPNQESNLYSCNMGHSAVNYRNVRKPNDSTYNSNNTHCRRLPDNFYSRNSDVVLLIPTTCLSCAGTTISMVLSKLGNIMESLVLYSLV